jgi:ABC-type antimicrobial peptide transport system permease subunit
MAKDRERKSMEPGDLIHIRDRDWVVTGIMKSAGSTFDSEIWAKQEIVASEFGKRGYTSGVLKTANDEIGQLLAEDATANFKTSGGAAISAQLETKYYERLNGTNLLFLVGSIVIVAIMAIGAVFGVMNAMFAAISQRTIDVGVLRILGYKRVHILISFFLESLLLALVGGVLGCAIGCLSNGWSMTSIVGGGGGGRSIVFQMAVSPRILLFGLAFSLLMGALGGFIPALSAMRLKPLESMR